MSDKKTEVFEIEKIEVSKLPELQGLIDSQEKILKENPFVKIVDAETYSQAKKSRTTLVTARTDIQNQKTAIFSKLNSLKDLVSKKTDELIEITKPAEILQQTEVKDYELKKELEKAEKIRVEKARVRELQAELLNRFDQAFAVIVAMTYSDIETVTKYVNDQTQAEPGKFAELLEDFNNDNKMLLNHLENYTKTVTEKEANRLEALRLKAIADKMAEDQKKFDADKKAQDEKAEADRKKLADDLAKKQAKFDADKKAQDEKIKAEQKKINDQKALIAKAEADKKAKAEAEKKAIEDKAKADKKILDDKAEADRIEAREKALRPDKVKINEFFNSLTYSVDNPGSKDPKLDEIVMKFIAKIKAVQVEAITSVKNY